MAVTSSTSDFDSWLCGKLADLDIDSEVYGSYITGILEEEDEDDNKNEALEGILGSLMEDSTDLCSQVLLKWNSVNHQEKVTEVKQTRIEDILAAHSAKVTEKTVPAPEKTSSGSGDSAMKRALLDKYAEVYEEIDEENESEKKATSKSTGAPPSIGLFQNINIKAVSDAEKQKRDKQKEDNQKKKEKDKLDREKQKQKKEDRKEKEKKRTQKKERSTR